MTPQVGRRSAVLICTILTLILPTLGPSPTAGAYNNECASMTANRTPKESPLLKAAHEANRAGISVIPIKADGSKEPRGRWKAQQNQCADLKQINAWFGTGGGLGIVCGAVSGKLEFLDFDTHDIFDDFVELAEQVGLGPVVDRIRRGYDERSPDGRHLPWRCDKIAGNQKLAKRYDPTGASNGDSSERPVMQIETLIETRGEGGYMIVAPSCGSVHESGQPYLLVSGGFATIATITPAEREDLLNVARSLDELLKREATDTGGDTQSHTKGTRPGDLYNATATWNEVLRPQGWIQVYERNVTTYWRRPGKDRGISATTNYQDSNFLYVFSTSTVFEAQRGYSKFAAYAVLNHSGNFGSAAAALAAAGYQANPENGVSTGNGANGATSASQSSDQIPLDIFGDTTIAGQPDLPRACLPSVIADFAWDEAERLGCDPVMLVFPCLAAVQAATDDAFQLQPKQHDTRWCESARGWFAVVHDPGQKHSPAQAAALAPLRAIEDAWYVEDDAAMEQYLVDEAVYKSRLVKYAKDKAAGKNPDQPEKPEKPLERRCLLSDTTIEAASAILKDNPSGVLAEFDELSSFFASFDAYRSKSTGKDRSHWLEAYNGGPHLIDRVNRGRVRIPNWSIGIVGGIQPGPMQRLAGKITDDGLVQRFVVAFAKPSLRGVDQPPKLEAVADYTTLIDRLMKSQPDDRRPVFTLSSDAQKQRLLVSDVADDVQCLPDTSAAFRAHLGKWDGLFARLTLTFHFAEHILTPPQDQLPPTEIAGQTAACVAQFMTDYLLPNAARFYRELLGEDDHLKHGRWIAGHILTQDVEKLTARDVGRAYRELRGDLPATQTAMRTLEAAGWVIAVDAHKRDGPTQWRVNQRIYTTFTKRAKAERERRAAEQQKIWKAARNLGLTPGGEGDA